MDRNESNYCGFEFRHLTAQERFPDLLEPVILGPVIPECFYPSIFLGTVRFSNRRESRRDRKLDPRLKLSGVTSSG